MQTALARFSPAPLTPAASTSRGGSVTLHKHAEGAPTEPTTAPPSDTATGADLLNVLPGVGGLAVDDALAAIDFMPPEDRNELRDSGLRIELHPVAGWTADGAEVKDKAAENPTYNVGETKIERDGAGAWKPTALRVAAHSGEDVVEAVLHEVGHALAVMRAQDTSETGAEAYVLRHLLGFTPDEVAEVQRLQAENPDGVKPTVRDRIEAVDGPAPTPTPNPTPAPNPEPTPPAPGPEPTPPAPGPDPTPPAPAPEPTPPAPVPPTEPTPPTEPAPKPEQPDHTASVLTGILGAALGALLLLL